MLRVAILTTLAGMMAVPAEGKWSPGSLADRVEACDLIVVGRLQEVESLGPGLRREWGEEWVETERWQGVIDVERPILGRVTRGDRLRLVWEDRTDDACVPFSSHERRRGQMGIWLLLDLGDGTFRAANWFWFLELDEENAVLSALRERVVIVHQKERELFRGARYEVTLIVRNPGEHPMTIPEVSAREDEIRIGQGVTLEAEFVPAANEWKPVPARNGRVVRTTGRTLIDAGSELRLDLDLRDYFEMDEPDGYYRVRFAVEGLAGDSGARWIVWDEPAPQAPSWSQRRAIAMVTLAALVGLLVLVALTRAIGGR